MKKKVLDKRTIAAIRRRQYMMMLADNGGERPTPPEPEPQWNMKVVAHPKDGYSMPQTTGNFTLVKQDGDTYYYQHDGSSWTGNKVLYESYVSLHWVVSDVTFKDCEHITRIGDYFLEDSRSLESINISALNNITIIGAWFLSSCNILKSIDTSSLSNVTRIDQGFLDSCYAIKSIDTSPLSKVTSIGYRFLAHCGIRQIDLTPLSNITVINAYFLYFCSALKQIDLTPLSNLTGIGGNFLSSCYELNSLKLPWTTIPTTSATSFMEGVPSTCSIEVPCEAVDVYKATSPWSNRASYIVGDC